MLLDAPSPSPSPWRKGIKSHHDIL
jgi:hypothetical protein